MQDENVGTHKRCEAKRDASNIGEGFYIAEPSRG